MTRSAPRDHARWLVPLVLLTAGCTTQTGPGAPAAAAPSPFADCTALTEPPAGRSVGSAPPTVAGRADTVGAGAQALPDLTLPCFTGDRPFRLAELKGPAVLNLWATFCGPCRDELPALQELADRTAGRLHVVGVDTDDSRDDAAAFATDLRITFPNLYDREKKLQSAVGKPVLPMTVFVDAAGRHKVYSGPPLDGAALAELVTRHTGVAVPS